MQVRYLAIVLCAVACGADASVSTAAGSAAPTTNLPRGGGQAPAVSSEAGPTPPHDAAIGPAPRVDAAVMLTDDAGVIPPSDSGDDEPGLLQGPSPLVCPRTELGFADVNVGEVMLHVACQGDGPALLFLHGYPEFYLAWSKLLAPLAAAGYRVIAPDQRGYDLSDKPTDVASYQIDHLVADIEGLVAATGQKRVLIVAHDWGGTVAWVFAHRHASSVRGLVVFAGPHPDIWGHPDVDPEQGQASDAYVPLLAGPFGEAAFALMFDSLLSPHVTSEELAKYHEAWNQPNAQVSMNNWYRANLSPTVTMPTNVTVTVPALVLWGMKDTFTTPSELDHLPQYVNDLEIVKLPEGDHFIEHGEPTALTQRITSFEQRVAR
jgi:pimeloyl-ACP methyl ester carboxylesterase